MTEAQTTALQQAYLILGEHFDQSVVVLNWEIEGGETLRTGSKLVYKSDAMTALGLLTWAQSQILKGDD